MFNSYVTLPEGMRVDYLDMCVDYQDMCVELSNRLYI